MNLFIWTIHTKEGTKRLYYMFAPDVEIARFLAIEQAGKMQWTDDVKSIEQVTPAESNEVRFFISEEDE